MIWKNWNTSERYPSVLLSLSSGCLIKGSIMGFFVRIFGSTILHIFLKIRDYCCKGKGSKALNQSFLGLLSTRSTNEFLLFFHWPRTHPSLTHTRPHPALRSSPRGHIWDLDMTWPGRLGMNPVLRDLFWIIQISTKIGYGNIFDGCGETRE